MADPRRRESTGGAGIQTAGGEGEATAAATGELRQAGHQQEAGGRRRR